MTDQDALLGACGVVLKRLHAAGLRLAAGPFFVAAGGSVRVASPLAVRRAKRLSAAEIDADFGALVAADLAEAPAARRTVEAAYSAGGAA